MLNAGEEREPDEADAATVIAAVVEAVAELNRSREREGAATAAEMRQRCTAIVGLVARMEEIRAGATAAFHKRLREKLSDLLRGGRRGPPAPGPGSGLLADRSDIEEELVRLRTHAAQLDAILAGEGEVGKRLDFLLQEDEPRIEYGPLQDRRAGRTRAYDYGAGPGGEIGDRQDPGAVFESGVTFHLT